VGRNRRQARRILTDNLDNKAAVSPSRPLNCSPPPFTETAAAVATFPTRNVIFTTPKFAFAPVRVHAEWRTTFAKKNRRFSKTSLRANKIRVSNKSSRLKFPRCHRRRRTTDLTWRQTHASWQRKQRRCLPLTSSDLLDASSISPRRFTARNFRRNAERVFLIFKQAVLCVFKHEASND